MCMEGAEVNEAVDQGEFVAKSTQIAQGGSMPVTFDRDGESIDGWTCTIYVKQYINDDATIVRQLSVDPECPTQWSGLLTSADTAQLDVGLWHVFANLKNVTTGEARQVKAGSIRFEVTQTVVQSITSSIFSVTDNATAARFNFSGTLLTRGQFLTIAGFVDGDAVYNGTQIVSSINAGGDQFFEAGLTFAGATTTITSVVSGTGGVARFNFTGSPVVIGDIADIKGFTGANIPYNGEHPITMVDPAWFETAVAFIGSENGPTFTTSQTTGTFTHLG